MWSSCVVSTHVFVDKKELGHALPSLREALTFCSKFDEYTHIPTYTETTTMFGFPRYHFPLTKSLAKHMIDKRVLGTDITFNSKSEFELWDYQEDLLKEFNQSLAAGTTGFFLEAAPGSGKTICAIKFIQSIGKTTLVVVPKSDLVQQWKDRISASTDIPVEKIATAQNGKIDENWRSSSIVIALVHTLGLNRFGEDFINHFGVVVFDEADASVPPTTFAPVAGMFPAKYRIGMTATRYRSDGLHKVFEKHMGQRYLTAKSSKTMIPAAIQVKYRESSGIFNSSLPYTFRRGQILTLLASNYQRTKLISNYTKRCYSAGRDTLVLSDRKDQLLEIHKLLLAGGVPAEDVGFFMRGHPKLKFERGYTKKVLQGCKIILGTYGMGSRGTDIQRLSALVLATPQMSMTQISGRIERFLQGKKRPLIIDIVDTEYEDLLKGGLARRKQYQKRSMSITDVEA